MAERGTFLGEIERGWKRFRGLSWWQQGLAGGLAAILLIVIIAAIVGGGDEENPSEVGDRTTSSPTMSASPLQSETPTASPEETASPSPEATERPLDTPEAIARSYRDNQSFAFRASADDLDVRWLPEQGGRVQIDIHPETVLTTGDSLTITAQSALVASKAIWDTYPDVEEITLTMFGSFIDQFGASAVEEVAFIVVQRSTGEQFQYDGLRDLVFADNKHLFCISDSYYIDLSIYQALGDVGCLDIWGQVKLASP